MEDEIAGEAHYVLVLLFVKYVSDKYAGQKDALLDVPRGGGFADMAALKGDKEIGDMIAAAMEKVGHESPITIEENNSP